MLGLGLLVLCVSIEIYARPSTPQDSLRTALGPTAVVAVALKARAALRPAGPSAGSPRMARVTSARSG